MKMINNAYKLLITAILLLPVNAMADAWSCSSSNNVREVVIERPTSSPVPCEVVYRKQTEGQEDQVLWNAQNDDSYCDEKAEGLVAKLEASGWVCTETISEEPTAE